MRILNMVFSGGDAMDWVNKLKGVEDTSAGIYIKARADISTRDHTKCEYYKQGLLACEYGLSELDPDFVRELEEIGYVAVRVENKKLILVLGENFNWYTDPQKSENPMKEFIRHYSQLCASYDIPNNAVFEAKTFSMMKSIMVRKNWKEIMEFCFKNWSWMKKELNVGLPTINVLSSTYYWRRMENQFKSKPNNNHVGNRHAVEEGDEEFEVKAPKIRK